MLVSSTEAVLELALLAGLAALGWLLHRAAARRDHDVRVLALVQTFAPAQAAAQHDPKQLLAWHPIAEATRKLYPAAFATLDAAAGERFPFSKEVVERAHARVSSEWLAWEAAHDEEYRIKAAAVEREITAASGEARALARARLDRVQHEKIERYQQRYEDYVRTTKGLQALLE